MGSIEEIQRLRHSKSVAEREMCALLLEEHLKNNPQDIESWFDWACCLDFLGREKEAESKYQRVYDSGPHLLKTELQKNFYLGFGSTLRNNQKLEASSRILSEGCALFSDYIPLKIFLAFTLYSENKFQDAAKILFQVCSHSPVSLDGYDSAIKWYAEQIGMPEDRSSTI